MIHLQNELINNSYNEVLIIILHSTFIPLLYEILFTVKLLREKIIHPIRYPVNS